MRRTSAAMQKVGAMQLRREQPRRSPVKASLTIPGLSCRGFQHFPSTSWAVYSAALALCAPPNLHAFSAAMKADGAA